MGDSLKQIIEDSLKSNSFLMIDGKSGKSMYQKIVYNKLKKR